MIENKTIADALEDVANLLEVEGEGAFRIRAYKNAADMIRFFGPPLNQMVAEGQDLTKLEDIGKGIAAKIHEIVEQGPTRFRGELEARYGPGLLDLLRIPGLGPKKVRTLRDHLEVRSVGELVDAIDAGRLSEVPGFGPKSIEGLRERLARLAEPSEGDAGTGD